MNTDQFEELKKTVASRLESLQQRTRKTLEKIDATLAMLEAQEDEARAILEQMDRASAKTPFGMLAYYYAKGMSRARGPVVHRDGGISEEYEEVSENTFREASEKFAKPATDAVQRVYPDAEQVLSDVQNYALTLRYFANSEPLLSQYAQILAPPWFDTMEVEDLKPKGPWRIHWYYGSLPWRLPPHIEIIARRRASMNTLHLLRTKLRALLSLLETTTTELAFASPRTEPAPVPSTWYDYSVTIGPNSRVEKSAIGTEATTQQRLL